jgi:hypothetical protein
VNAKPIVLKALLQQRHLQTHSAFRREYDRVAEKVDKSLKAGWPSKAQFYRWLSGELVGLPHVDHCRVLESMFPGWAVAQMFEAHDGPINFVPEPRTSQTKKPPHPTTPAMSGSDATSAVVWLYHHRADTPKELWMELLRRATANIDLFANASLFLPEENPEAIEIIKKKAAAGIAIRIMLADPDHPAAELRGREERLFEGIPGRIKMAWAYYRPLIGVDGIEFHMHGTSLYNSIFRYDDQMLINQHIYGAYGYIAPILHLRKVLGADLFETYLKSFDLIWNEESFDIKTKDSPAGGKAG